MFSVAGVVERCSSHRLVEKLLLILFFEIDYIKISRCAKPLLRDVFFFYLEKNLGSGNIL